MTTNRPPTLCVAPSGPSRLQGLQERYDWRGTQSPLQILLRIYLGMSEEILSQDSEAEIVDSGGSVLLRRRGGTIPGSRKFLFSYKLIFILSISSVSASLFPSKDLLWLAFWRQFSWWMSRRWLRLRRNVCRIRKNHIDMVHDTHKVIDEEWISDWNCCHRYPSTCYATNLFKKYGDTEGKTDT